MDIHILHVYNILHVQNLDNNKTSFILVPCYDVDTKPQIQQNYVTFYDLIAVGRSRSTTSVVSLKQLVTLSVVSFSSHFLMVDLSLRNLSLC